MTGKLGASGENDGALLLLCFLAAHQQKVLRQDSPAASHPPPGQPHASASTAASKRPSATLIAKDLLQTQGLAGLYKGLGATVLR